LLEKLIIYRIQELHYVQKLGGLQTKLGCLSPLKPFLVAPKGQCVTEYQVGNQPQVGCGHANE